MGYTIHSSHVRVDRFKESGKWYDTLEVDMEDHYYDNIIQDALRRSINESYSHVNNFVDGWLAQGGSFVCLEPYHQNSHPVMLKEIIK